MVIQNFDPIPDIETLIQKYDHKITYLAGKVLDKQDLKRADIHRSNACILLVNKNSRCANEDDYKNILNALSIKKAVYNLNKDGKDDEKSNMRIIMQLLKPDSKLLY